MKLLDAQYEIEAMLRLIFVSNCSLFS